MLDRLLPRNESTADRVIRVILGLALLGVALSGTSALGWLGIVPLVTGAVGSCPLYSLFGMSTCPVEPRAT